MSQSIVNYLNLNKEDMEKIHTENVSYNLTNWYVFATEPMKAYVGNRVIAVVILSFGTSCR
jgi:hypothetical protein